MMIAPNSLVCPKERALGEGGGESGRSMKGSSDRACKVKVLRYIAISVCSFYPTLSLIV